MSASKNKEKYTGYTEEHQISTKAPYLFTFK